MRSNTLLRLCLALAVACSAGETMAREFVVMQKDQQFTPKSLTVKVGDEVVFVNDDTGTHNVFSESAANAFDLKAQRPGTRTKVAFPKAGRIDIRCAIHPSMRMLVEVQ